jgi:hypothetical protein
MATRDAVCSCGQLHLTAEGDPIRISMCHCLACQRRTGSAFGIQARFTSNQVRIVGRYKRLRANLRRGRDENLSFLPRLRRDRFLHALDSARCCCRSDRRICRAGLSAADGFGVRVPTPSVASYDCRDGTQRLKAPRLSSECTPGPAMRRCHTTNRVRSAPTDQAAQRRSRDCGRGRRARTRASTDLRGANRTRRNAARPNAVGGNRLCR